MAALVGATLIAVLETATVALTGVLVPEVPLQVSVKVLVGEVSGPVFFVPLVRSVPLQAPEAVQDVELSELQVRVDVPLGATTVGEADNTAVGTVVTVTVALAALLVPPAPAQVSEKEVVLLSAPVLLLPLGANEPLHPPEAVHEVAFVELQVRVELAFCPIKVGDAVNLAVGAILTMTLAAWLMPPPPVQVRENVVAAVKGPVLLLPLLASVPVQPPEAAQDVAFVELHVSVVASPLFTAFLAALSETVGGAVLEEPPPHATNSRVAPMPTS
ncbi:MAG TPA: hypothetical protein VGL55_00125 [Steroidobacteraceae bacterium]|jgi:hypothetical protein